MLVMIGPIVCISRAKRFLPIFFFTIAIIGANWRIWSPANWASGRRRKCERDCKGQGTAELDYRFHDVSFGLEDDDAFARIVRRGSAARDDLDPVGDGLTS